MHQQEIPEGGEKKTHGKIKENTNPEIFKWSNIHAIRILEEVEKENGADKIFEKKVRIFQN